MHESLQSTGPKTTQRPPGRLEVIYPHPDRRPMTRRLYPEGCPDDVQFVAEVGHWRGDVKMDQYAHGLAACWNACEGINPEAVPDLLVALRRAVHEGALNGLDLDWVGAALAAITKAEGGAV